MMMLLFFVLAATASDSVEHCLSDGDCSDTDRRCHVMKCVDTATHANDLLNNVCAEVPVRNGVKCDSDDCRSEAGVCVDGACRCAPAESASVRESGGQIHTSDTSSHTSTSTTSIRAVTSQARTFTPPAQDRVSELFSSAANSELGGVKDIDFVGVSDDIIQMEDEDDSSRRGGNGNLGAGAIAGIVVASLAALLGLLALAAWQWHKKKRSSSSSSHIMPLSSTAMSDMNMTSARDRSNTAVDDEDFAPANAVQPAPTRNAVQMYGPVNPESAAKKNGGAPGQLLRGAALYDAPPKGFGVNDPSMSAVSGKSHYESVHDPLVR